MNYYAMGRHPRFDVFINKMKKNARNMEAKCIQEIKSNDLISSGNCLKIRKLNNHINTFRKLKDAES